MQQSSFFIISNNTKKQKNNYVTLNKLRLRFFSLICLLVLVLLALNPQIYIASTLNGLLVYASILLPSLLPFFVFTKLLTSLQVINQFLYIFNPLTKFLFNVPSIASYIFFMSVISGYPVGAKLLLECYEEGLITIDEAKKILTFTSNSGPMFIIGTVGVGMLLSKQAGYIMLLSHFLGSILNGVFYSRLLPQSTSSKYKPQKKEVDLNNILNKCMNASINSLLIIGGYVAVFFTIIEILNYYQVFDFLSNLLHPLFLMNETTLKTILEGLLEITKGCFSVKSLMLPIKQSVLLCNFIISFGGVCVLLQAMSFLNACKIKTKFYFLQKLTHTLFSTIICFLLLQVIVI